MANIIEFNEFTSTCTGAPGELYCWLCQKGVSYRALFCHHCGSIQPVRELDHFARLGLERRIDIDIELLERQYEAMQRTLDPVRFAIRGIGERGHAAKQMESIVEAFETLRDPLRRGRYWLTLNQKEFEELKTANPLMVELRGLLDSAADTMQCDRIAQKAGQAMEDGILGLMQALRGQNWQEANAALVELAGLETLLNNVRERRAQLAPESVKIGETLASVK